MTGGVRLLFVFSLFFLQAAALAGGGEGHIPVKTLATHAINLLVFVALIYWALFHKAKIGAAARAQREQMVKEIADAKKALQEAKRRHEELKRKMDQLNQEVTSIISNSEKNAHDTAEKMRIESEMSVRKILSEAGVLAQQELKRMEERVTSNLIEAVMVEAEKRLSEKLEIKTDETVIQQHLKQME